jgi:NTP pyrophosphatase (non-canonical NTP hydrolase)
LTPGTLSKIEREQAKAAGKYGAFTSTHEALGVLIEEYEELKDAIRANDLSAVAHEAVQVAAVAARLADACAGKDFQKRSRK